MKKDILKALAVSLMATTATFAAGDGKEPAADGGAPAQVPALANIAADPLVPVEVPAPAAKTADEVKAERIAALQAKAKAAAAPAEVPAPAPAAKTADDAKAERIAALQAKAKAAAAPAEVPAPAAKTADEVKAERIAALQAKAAAAPAEVPAPAKELTAADVKAARIAALQAKAKEAEEAKAKTAEKAKAAAEAKEAEEAKAVKEAAALDALRHEIAGAAVNIRNMTQERDNALADLKRATDGQAAAEVARDNALADLKVATDGQAALAERVQELEKLLEKTSKERDDWKEAATADLEIAQEQEVVPAPVDAGVAGDASSGSEEGKADATGSSDAEEVPAPTGTTSPAKAGDSPELTAAKAALLEAEAMPNPEAGTPNSKKPRLARIAAIQAAHEAIVAAGGTITQ